jgi:uncharacterized protein (TIGR03663 family)
MSPTDGSENGSAAPGSVEAGDPPADQSPTPERRPGENDAPAPDRSPGTGGAADTRPLPARLDRSLRRHPFGQDRVLQALVGLVLVGLVLRLLFLGDRTAHFDEGRVAYWAHYSLETGSFAYRRIIHGPLLQHVDRWLFGLLGANDFVMRLPVAVLGALLPLSALMFRRHLRRLEVVVVGAFLTFNPVMLYYSRFMRSDLLVATFMFVAFGFVVRYYDTRRRRYLYLASAATALGFGSKENALVYVLVWGGAAALLADQALYRPRGYASGARLLWAKVDGLADRVHAGSDRVTSVMLEAVGTGVVVAVIFLAISVFIYAPRGAGMEGLHHPPTPPSEGAIGLWQAVGNPLLVPDLLAATADHTIAEFTNWFGAASDPGCGEDTVIGGWLCFLGQFVDVMATKAAPLSIFAVGGFLYERYGRADSRNLVVLMAYAGFVAVIGYPLGTDVWGAWLTVHAIVPLSIPAAVGVSLIGYWGYEAHRADDREGVAIAVAVLAILAALTGTVIVGSVYANDTSADNTLVQFAQPADDAGPALDAMATISDRTDGPHLLLYNGEPTEDFDSRRAFLQKREADFDRSGLAFYPMCSRFHASLPLPWYIAKDDVETECERDLADLRTRLAEDPPPVLITQDYDATVPTQVLERSYVERTYRLRTYTRETTFWIHEDHADALADR